VNRSLTSVERVRILLGGGIPDRVPVHLHNFLMTALNSGLPFPDYLQNGEAMARGQIDAWQEYRHDVLLLENGTTALAEACGCRVEYLADSAPVMTKPVLERIEDVTRLEIPDPYKAHPLSENLKATRLVAEEIGEQAFLMGRADQGPFSLASMLVGLETFMLALSDPDQYDNLRRLLEFSLEVVYCYATAQMAQGAHMTSIGESLSGPDVTSPRMYREFEWGYARRLAERLTEKQIPLAYHICGNATRIVGDMVSTGAAVLELDYKCDLEKIKAATQGKAVILGVVDPSGVLALGSPELVVDTTQKTLSVLAPQGGLIFGPGCALPASSPAENIHAMIHTAHAYGRYSPDGSLLVANAV
jgi:uroporphyrinogen decarboxylase